MKHLIEFSLEGDDSILVEVEEPEKSGTHRVSRPGEVVLKATQSFDAALDKIKPIAAKIITKIRTLNEPPDEVEVKFGLKMSAEAGAVIAAASVEGNYEITLKWKRQ